MGDTAAVDKRMVCKYGSKCFQKNPAHHQKFKHPPKRPLKNENDSTPTKKFKVDEEKESKPTVKATDNKVSNDISDSEGEEAEELHESTIISKKQDTENKAESVEQEEKIEGNKSVSTEKKFTPLVIKHKDFIFEKFLVKMPEDFYQFWEFCKKIKPSAPSQAYNEIGLRLVGPFDVLADKFCNVEEKSDEEYLVHWRYYYDPPEFQTVLKGEDSKGYHIGYFRDDPKEDPAFLACNYARSDGIFEKMGPNIFSAVNIYMEQVKTGGDPFKKLKVVNMQKALKEEAEKLNVELGKKPNRVRDRGLKVVATAFNKIGIVVPYNKRSQVGYRELTMSNKDLKALLTKIKTAHDDQVDQFLNELQSLLTNTSIAMDECDFGTGLELGLDILSFGIDRLNRTTGRFLSNSYNLLKRDAFAKIALAHMNNRRKGGHLSIL